MQEPAGVTDIRPSLMLATVAFHRDDVEAATRLGNLLYDRLGRPLADELAHGPGIPVYSAVAPHAVDVAAATRMLIVPVLGSSALLTCREVALKLIAQWHAALGDGAVVPLFRCSEWASAEADLPGKPIRHDPAALVPFPARALDEIALAALRLLEADTAPLQLFVSHAKADLGPTGDAARSIYRHTVDQTTLRAFFDETGLASGVSIAAQLDAAVRRSVFVAVRTDSYSARSWCQAELLQAKQAGMPTLVVEVMRNGEQRVSAYAGNGPSLVWRDDPAAVVSQAIVVLLAAAFFRCEAQRLATLAGLPQDTTVLCRPPELLDLAQGPLEQDGPAVVIHPDPELPVVERELLTRVNPRLRLVTPASAYGRLLEIQGTSGANPLDGTCVALSLSNSPDAGGELGFGAHHVRDAATTIVRNLVSAGAAIAYGGDFRAGGMTELLGHVVAGYSSTASDRSQLLHSFLSANVAVADAPANWVASVKALGDNAESLASLPPPAPGETSAPLHVSDMRRAMTEFAQARVLLGGQTSPGQSLAGYGGRYPGVVEEAWWSLRAGQPLYLLGGFGGAASLVCGLVDGGEVPDLLRDETWADQPEFVDRARRIDEDPLREQLELPRRQQDLALAVAALGRGRLADDATAVAWNGLSVRENRQLFRRRDPALLASLIIKGLMTRFAFGADGKLAVELVRGPVSAASGLGAIAVATVDGLPLVGADAALAPAVAAWATDKPHVGPGLLQLESGAVDARWLYVEPLHGGNDLGALDRAVSEAAQRTARMAVRHGIEQLGITTFAQSMYDDPLRPARVMLEHLDGLRDQTRLVWFESEPSRFGALRELLGADPRVRLTTRVARAPDVFRRQASAQLIVHVTLEEEQLTVTTVAPRATAVAPVRRVTLGNDVAQGLSGSEDGGAPSLVDLASRGAELATLLFGDDARELPHRHRETGMLVVHDREASRLPFETLLLERGAGEAQDGTVRRGLARRLAVVGASVASHTARPPSTTELRLLLVVNPNGDLPGAEREADAVEHALSGRDGIVVSSLRGSAATRTAVLDGIADADVLHYSGHAYFQGSGDAESGLCLADGELTLGSLREQPLPVRVAFVNACESARMRGPGRGSAAAFAEAVLRSGTEAYVGTFWQVQDDAAADFAASVYAQLVEGHSLSSAITNARAALLQAGMPDWANYSLYGNGDFRIRLAAATGQ